MDEQGELDERDEPWDESPAAPPCPTVAEQIAEQRALRAQVEADRRDLINLRVRLVEQQRDLWRKQAAEREQHPRRPGSEASSASATEHAAPAALPPEAQPAATAPVPASPDEAHSHHLPAEAQTAALLPDPLTTREMEVLRLLVRGLTNREIARALGITRGTAKAHVEHILAKLGARSRAHAAAEAVSLGLIAASDSA